MEYPYFTGQEARNDMVPIPSRLDPDEPPVHRLALWGHGPVSGERWVFSAVLLYRRANQRAGILVDGVFLGSLSLGNPGLYLLVTWYA